MTTIKKKLAPDWEEIDGARYLVAPLSAFDAIDFGHELRFKNKRGLVSGEGIRIASKAVRDWQGVRDENGQEVKFDPDLVEQLPLDVLRELALRVFRRTFLSETERKN